MDGDKARVVGQPPEHCKWCKRALRPDTVHIPLAQQGKCTVIAEDPDTGSFDHSKGVRYYQAEELQDAITKLVLAIAEACKVHEQQQKKIPSPQTALGNINIVTLQVIDQIIQMTVNSQEHAIKKYNEMMDKAGFVKF